MKIGNRIIRLEYIIHDEPNPPAASPPLLLANHIPLSMDPLNLSS